MYIWVALKESKISNDFVASYGGMFESRISAGAKEKLLARASGKPDAETISSWSHDMEGHAKKCVDMQMQRLNNCTKSQRHVWMNDQQFKEKEIRICWGIVCSLLTNCSDMSAFGSYWETRYSMVCEQTCSCGHKMDKNLVTNALARWISYIHHTSEYRQYCYVGNTAQQCRLGLFQDSDFAGDLEHSKSTSGGVLCIFGSHTFVPMSWMCKKQTSVSHSSTEAEINSLDAGLRMDGIPALTLWGLVIEVLHFVPSRTE